MLNKSRAIAGRTTRCLCTFQYVLNFTTTSCGFSAIARLSCIVLHQRPFKTSNAEITHYANFHSHDVRHGDSRKSRHTTSKHHGTLSLEI